MIRPYPISDELKALPPDTLVAITDILGSVWKLPIDEAVYWPAAVKIERIPEDSPLNDPAVWCLR